jgi:RNA polymerase sigma-70 factor (ECF subfamily)
VTAPEPEHELVRQAQAGSSQAFARLVDAHQQGLRAFLRRLSGNWAEADDLAQEAFVAAWTDIRRFREGHAFRTWLCGIGYRKFLMAQRTARRQRRRDASALEHQDGVSSELSTEERLDLLRALHSLPVDQRAAVALCLAAGFSHAEAAAALELPLGTVKSHVQRGRSRLLAALGGDDEGGGDE